jgi:lysozyme family protein
VSFERAFSIVIGAEGGYVDDPQDPGGETKYGISKRAYPAVDIKNLTLEQARDIYLRDYWLAAGCHRGTEVMAILIFDCAVNQGVSRARQIASIANDPVSFQAERALLYASLPTFGRFGRGWMRRLFSVLQQATEPK